MSNFFIYILIFFMFICGGLSSAYVVVSLPVVIIYKLYRKIKYKENLL